MIFVFFFYWSVVVEVIIDSNYNNYFIYKLINCVLILICKIKRILK